MKAVIAEEYGEPDVLGLGERPDPGPASDEVLVEIEASGINFADIEKRRGDYPDGPDIRTPTPPYVPGGEPAGRVVEAGADADFEVGDDVMGVMCYSSYCEYVAASPERLMPIPDGLDYEEAAGIPVQFLTAHNVLYEWGGLQAGETVLIHAGAGGVGSAAIQLADLVDCTIYATASTERKREFTREIGADRPIDYTERSVSSVAEEELDEGFDLVLDGVGGRTFKESVRSLAPGGRLVSYGIASGRVPTVATPRLLFQNRSVLGYHLEHAAANLPDRVESAEESVLRAFGDDQLDVFVDRTFPLSDAAEAHRYIESRESIGKVVLEP